MHIIMNYKVPMETADYSKALKYLVKGADAGSATSTQTKHLKKHFCITICYSNVDEKNVFCDPPFVPQKQINKAPKT